MIRHQTGGGVETVLLYVHSFKLLLAHTFWETERMAGTDPETLVTTADKLRYCRHVRRLEQQEVAAYVTLHRSTYVGYETSGARDYYPLDKLSALAELFEVPLEYLLDDYNSFLYKGQGLQVRELRESMGLSRREFAAKFGVWTTAVRGWETDSVRMTRQTWEKLFR